VAIQRYLEWVSRQDMKKAAETIVRLAMIREERAWLSPRHCERSEAIHASRKREMDCFASLAMTV
jgi:hypothetical protein